MHVRTYECACVCVHVCVCSSVYVRACMCACVSVSQCSCVPSAYQSKVDQVFTKVPVVEIQLSTVRVMEATGRV